MKRVSGTSFRGIVQRRVGKLVPDASSGFTLIELLVVVAILGILAAIVVPRIMDRPDEARRVAAKADIAAIAQALKLYRLDNGGYPTTDQGLIALVQKPTTNPVPANWKQQCGRHRKLGLGDSPSSRSSWSSRSRESSLRSPR